MDLNRIDAPRTAPARARASQDRPELASAAEAPRDVVTFVYDARGGPPVQNLGLKGSFDPASGRYDPLWNGGQVTPMHDDGQGGDVRAGDGLYTAQVSLDASERSTFSWGVVGDVLHPDGSVREPARWLVMTEAPPTFTLDANPAPHTLRPTVVSDMGVQRIGDDGVRFKTWSPALGQGDLAAYSLHVELFDDAGQPVRSLPMQRDARDGTWCAELESGWRDLEGKGYRYAARDTQGRPLVRTFADGSKRAVAYADPYARYVQGPQRGLEAIHVDPVLGVETGWYDASSNGGPNYAINPRWARFSIPGHAAAERVSLRITDAAGQPLTRAQLLERLGPPALVPYEQATPAQRSNVDTLRRWQIDTSAPVTRYAWLDRTAPDGTIELTRVGDASSGATWTTALNGFDALVGLRYQIEVHEGGRVAGDSNGDGVLQPAEARRTPFNDPYSDVIAAQPGNERLALVRSSSYAFRHDGVPRKEADPRRFVIYEAHVGSFMGSRDNAHACTFADMMRHLDHVEALGANTLEIMPVQEFGGERDWGYTPDFMFAGAEAYGFEMPRDEAERIGVLRPEEQVGRESVWVSGTDAIKVFVDEAHRRGLNVLSDVVYNHVAGRPDAQNPLDLIDGDQQSFFRWEGRYVSDTPWGAKPNFGAQAVKDFYTANAVQQLTELHFDGMRFDFTQVLHNTGTVDEKRHGMDTLRQINRTVELLRPGTYTVAEDFTRNWLVAADLSRSEVQGDMVRRGMGFDGVWNDSFHHTLLDTVEGKASMDDLLGALSGHRGVSRPEQAVVYAHSHDEVGNSGRWVIRSAAGSVQESAVLAPWPRAMARTAAALTLTSSGVPMLWQGEESLANNDFKHAMPQTWGTDTSWRSFPILPHRLDDFARIASLGPDEKAQAVARLAADERALFARYDALDAAGRAQAAQASDRNGHFRFYQDLVRLRATTPALEAGTRLAPIYAHNDDRICAYLREGGSDQVVVVSSFANTARDGYRVNLPPGRWQVVLNSDDRQYGGAGGGSHGEVDGNAPLSLPPGATLVLKRVSP